ncbi:serine/threonine/tyrosine-interacting-like protein 1 isoform X3 [Tiliqua scincoides]|uniref:serine/threonine/tyrosine-interacting-like protein 1 isoform X3 n=1 Tax=Tiliqua scincoides TaxID=71010 RepID=UPI0034623F2B
MAGVALCEPTELYNILNQATKISRLAEPNYLCLLDARTKREYNESHVITAIRVKQNLLGKYMVPQSVDLECVRYCVVYDGKTDSLEAAFDVDYDIYDVDKDLKVYGKPDITALRGKVSPTENAKSGSAARCARVLQRLTHFPVMVLRGGYELFTRSYHFLRTQKIFYMPRVRKISELEDFKPYPVEILPSKLYLGDYEQACSKQIQKELKIRAQINVCEEVGTFFLEEGSSDLLHISIPDSPEADMLSSFTTICHFIDSHIHKEAVLVFSTRGISRSSTAIIAYLMHSCRLYLKKAWSYVLKCKANMRPNRGFVQQLSDWEKRIYMSTITDISEPNY